jgi:hypothetical protein
MVLAEALIFDRTENEGAGKIGAGREASGAADRSSAQASTRLTDAFEGDRQRQVSRLRRVAHGARVDQRDDLERFTAAQTNRLRLRCAGPRFRPDGGRRHHARGRIVDGEPNPESQRHVQGTPTAAASVRAVKVGGLPIFEGTERLHVRSGSNLDRRALERPGERDTAALCRDRRSIGRRPAKRRAALAGAWATETGLPLGLDARIDEVATLGCRWIHAIFSQSTGVSGAWQFDGARRVGGAALRAAIAVAVPITVAVTLPIAIAIPITVAVTLPIAIAIPITVAVTLPIAIVPAASHPDQQDGQEREFARQA